MHFHTAPHVKHNFICGQNFLKITLGGKSSSKFLWHGMFFLYFLLFKLYVGATLTFSFLSDWDGKGYQYPLKSNSDRTRISRLFHLGFYASLVHARFYPAILELVNSHVKHGNLETLESFGGDLATQVSTLCHVILSLL